MQKGISLLIASIFFISIAQAKGGKDSLELAFENQIKLMDSIQSALKWETSTVTIADGAAKLNLSGGFKFLNAQQSQYILHDVWGNPPRTDVIGMIFSTNGGPYADSSYAFIITYEEDGYVKDDEADKINYTDMLKQLKEAEIENNKVRAQQGYEPMHIIGWAETPYYDKANKVLYWAKEFHFGNETINTLNYEVRVLGRKGVLSLNAVATMAELPLVKANIASVLKIPTFTEGNKYSDFNSNTDKVAEYGIGALVAGGILAKTGALAAIGKFLVVAWKFILLGIVGAWGAIKKFFGKKKKDEGDDYYDRVSQYKP